MKLRHTVSLIDTMARMALKGYASRFYLGYIWWVLEPLLYVAVFYIVFDLLLGNRPPDYLVFLMVGKLTFIWFSKTVNLAAESIVRGAGLIGKLNIPKYLFPLAVVQEGTYKQLAVFALLFTVLLIQGYLPGAQWVWLLPLLIANWLMIAAAAMVGAYLVCMVRDFSPLISLAMVFLLFTSGIFWDVREIGDPNLIALFLALNPLAFLIDAYRQVLMYGAAPAALHLLLIGIVSAALLAAVTWQMQRASQYLALKALT